MINRALTQEEVTHEMTPIWDGYDVLMRDNDTGEERLIHENLTWYDHSLFFWQEGNFSCDCNRGMEFFNNHDLDFPCSHYTTQRFTVIKVMFADGSEEQVDS